MARIDDRFLDVNRFGVLRIPVALWLGLVFLARGWIIGFLVLISAYMSPDTLRLITPDLDWRVAIIEVPAVFLLWLCVRRRPEAGNLIRYAWPFARMLAATTAALHVMYVAWYLWGSGYWLPWPELFLVSCTLIDVAIIAALYSSHHLNQVFEEFPAPLDGG